MKKKLIFIKKCLGTGSINIFGLPMSGKDTVGKRLAEDLGAKFLSSGDIIREYEKEHETDMTASGALIPTNKFYDIVLPYFRKKELRGKPLVLSSIGRWEGEETKVIMESIFSRHPIEMVLVLDIDEKEARRRWKKARELGDRGERSDDLDPEVFETRIREFMEKTVPVIGKYMSLNLAIGVDASGNREKVYERVVDMLYEYCKEMGDLFVGKRPPVPYGPFGRTDYFYDDDDEEE